jgi:hypothetical protein
MSLPGDTTSQSNPKISLRSRTSDSFNNLSNPSGFSVGCNWMIFWLTFAEVYAQGNRYPLSHSCYKQEIRSIMESRSIKTKLSVAQEMFTWCSCPDPFVARYPIMLLMLHSLPGWPVLLLLDGDTKGKWLLSMLGKMHILGFFKNATRVLLFRIDAETAVSQSAINQAWEALH